MSVNWNLRIAMAVLAVLIAFRPGIGGAVNAEEPVGSDLEVLLVVDETLSMSALDHAGAPVVGGGGQRVPDVDRQSTEGVAVEVDAIRVGDDEAVAEGRQQVGLVERLGGSAVWR